MRLKLGYHEILVFKVHDSINHGLYRFYTCHSTLLVDVGVVIQQQSAYSIDLQRT